MNRHINIIYNIFFLGLHGSNAIYCSFILANFPVNSGECFILWRPLVALTRGARLRHITEVITENMAAPSKTAVVLKAVKKIAVQFSPFESNVRSTR